MENDRATPSVSLEAAVVARRYFIDDRQKSEIADELKISRFKVARLLDEARAAGIVRIYVDMPTGIDVPLGESLASAYGISRAIVVEAIAAAPDATLGLLGRAAADYLKSILRADDVLGVSWGSTLTTVVGALGSLPSAEVVQLVGGIRGTNIGVGGVELVRRLAESTRGQAFPLHAPLLVATPEIAAQLRRDPSLADAIARFDRLTIALVGIGSWRPPHSSLYTEFADAERVILLERGAVGDVCTIVVDADGQLVESSASARSIAIDGEQLRRTPQVIAVAGGAAKVAAIGAVLRTGLVSTLVTDSTTAVALVRDHADPS